ncbi:membrane protein [Vallitalea longa]|uniref:Membrane protein n=1 Tax=Vallitalea longa TaxID=2936439 RepID=A0A9W5YFX9_9FIRM|nr:DUF2809 domain-containing protein [Vallitalea longa]GKX32066.1 membrane protein [Vallitalea longa]
MKLNKKYILIFLIILFIEIGIASFLEDSIIRPYIGDILVVVLIYTLIRGLIPKVIKLLPIYIFILATMVEFAQYLHIVDMLNLQDSKLLSIIIGSTFDVKDIVCYLIGTVILFIWIKIEKNINNS